ncbi:MAG: V-type ATP synthase subunit I [bacterium]
MSVEKLKKIEFVALRHIKDELLEILQHHGIVHITSISNVIPEDLSDVTPAELSSEPEHTGRTGQIEYALNYLARFDTSKKGFLSSLTEEPIKVSKKEINSFLTDFDLEGIIKTCQEMDKTAQALNTEEKELNANLKELVNWQELNIPLKTIKEGTKFTDFYTILLSVDKLNLLKKGLESSCSAFAINEIQDIELYKSFLVTAFKSERTRVEEQINNCGAQSISLPSSEETPDQLIQKYQDRLEEIKKEKAEIFKKGENLLPNVNKLKILFDYYKNQGSKREVQSRFGFTNQTVIITGWVKEKDINKLNKGIEHFQGELDIDIFEPRKDEAPPVALANNRFASPFILVTKLYDLPHYRELDPTPILAPFFFLFFGLCMTDLGYGLLIALVCLWGLKRLNIKGSGRTLLQLFFLCGISTFICGALAGSWFGDIVNYLPGWLGFLKKINLSLAIINPIKDPLKFLILSLSLGYIQVVTGILVQMYKDIKANDYYTAFLVRVPWVGLLTGLILFVITKNKNVQLASIFKWLSISSAVVIFLCEGKNENNILKRIGTGFIALYGIVGYYADMLSYCRLLALGLATAVIATVVNQMAILSKGIPYIGIVFMLGILIAGHLFNLLINSLGAFVHTSRLQFVEFFTKFFEGGGKPFLPFEKQNRYTSID